MVILHYSHKEDTLECIESVKRSDFKDFEIILVDNASGDDLSDIKDVTFVKSEVNTGYSGGNNIGIKKALSLDPELILILNPDTTIEKNTISTLIAGMERYGAGVVCPKIYFDGTKKIWYAGKDFDRLNVLGLHRGMDQEDKGQFDEDKETEANGAAMLVKREVFEKVGLFDDRYFLYLEDSDFSLRVRAAGYKIMYIHKAMVFHKNARSTGLGSPLQDYYITRNRMLFASKFLPFRTRFALFREVIKNIGMPMRRLALWDFLTGKFGKGSYA